MGLEGFARQLADAASGFAEATFTDGERRAARGEPAVATARLAARFAAKEAFIKAWSSARRGRPHELDAVDMREIEVTDDGWGRPALALHGAVAEAVGRLAGGRPVIHLSLTHDGPAAGAVVVLERAAAGA